MSVGICIQNIHGKDISHQDFKEQNEYLYTYYNMFLNTFKYNTSKVANTVACSFHSIQNYLKPIRINYCISFFVPVFIGQQKPHVSRHYSDISNFGRVP